MLKILRDVKLPKKRYFALGFIALELASIPAAAQIIDRVAFSVEPTTSAVLIDKSEGQSRYAVASNGAFYVTADHVIGDVTIEVHKSGEIGSTRFGDNAQMPGAALACSTIHSGENTVYQAERKTALNPGDILSQAVIVIVKHDSQATPVIRIKSGKSNVLPANSISCAAKLA